MLQSSRNAWGMIKTNYSGSRNCSYTYNWEHGNRCEDNVKLDLRGEIGWEGVDWIR
jgi:hypothetical protein